MNQKLNWKNKDHLIHKKMKTKQSNLLEKKQVKVKLKRVKQIKRGNSILTLQIQALKLKHYSHLVEMNK